MKHDVMPSIVQMDETALKNLVAEVKETVATGIKLNEKQKDSFKVVDMWNIRRNAKSASQMMVRRY
jgi:hypothetical protein